MGPQVLLATQRSGKFVLLSMRMKALVAIPLSLVLGSVAYVNKASASHMMLFFQMAFGNIADNSLVVESGQTKTLAEGYDYAFLYVWIKSGGKLIVNGSSATNGKMTSIYSQRAFIVDGTLQTTYGQLVTSNTYRGDVYSSHRTQATAGTGTGTVGSNGYNAGSLIVYAEDLQGDGLIDASGQNGSKGANAGVSSYTCPASYTDSNGVTHSYTLSPVCNHQTCLDTSALVYRCSCTINCQNYVKNDQRSPLSVLYSMFSIGEAYAGDGGGLNCTGVCGTQTGSTPIAIYSASNGGGGAGGAGGDVWIVTKEQRSGNVTVNTTGGSGGAPGDNGTTATAGSNGISGSVTYWRYE